MSKKTTLDNIESTRNTQKQVSWYEERADYIDNLDIPSHRKVDTFPVFSTRQKVTRFLETLRYWELVEDVPGDIYECGVAGGEFLMSMAHFSSIYEPHHYTRKIVGFDTFEGFTEPSSEDKTTGAAHVKKGGLHFDSLSYLKDAAHFYDQNRMIGNIPKVDLIKGDISKTLPDYLEQHPATVISLLHLDLDLYAPTKSSIELAISRMPKGAVIVFDEINHRDYPGETIAVMETLGLSNLRLRRVRESSMAGYAVIGD